MYSKETLIKLKNLVDPLQILLSVGGLNYSDISDRHTEYRCPCPIHGGDNKMAFCWSKTYDGWKCFTKHCGENENTGNDAFGFVQLKTGCDFNTAVEVIADLCNYDLTDADKKDSVSEHEVLMEIIKSSHVQEKARIKDVATLQELPNFYKEDFAFELVENYIKTRNYSCLKDISKYNLYPFLDHNRQLRVGIPHYNVNGDLVGVNARKMDTVLNYEPIQSPKYFITKGFKKENILFNLNNVQLKSPAQSLLIVEGEFSCIRLNYYGWVNSVAAMGCALSSPQITLAFSKSLNLHFLLERGDAARKGFVTTVKRLKQAGISVVYFSELPDKDPDEASLTELEVAINNPIELRVDSFLSKNNLYEIFKYD